MVNVHSFGHRPLCHSQIVLGSLMGEAAEAF
jgi:hypothetical protein